MMQVMRDIGGVEIPESLAKLAGEGESEKTTGNGRPSENPPVEEVSRSQPNEA